MFEHPEVQEMFIAIVSPFFLPIGSMYGIYANIGGILMVNVTIYIAYMDPMGMISCDFRYLPIMSEKNPGKSSICELNLH